MNYTIHVLEVGHENAFLGFNADRAKTPFTVVGAPLDISSSFRGGCREAPASIRTASKSLELCSLLTGLNMEYIGFEDIGNIVLSPGDINASLKRIEEVVKELLGNGRIPILIGGEHTITLPGFKALALSSSSPCLLVFDAHADLRDEYLGSRYNHATVIRRTLDETKGNVLLVGSRAISKEEVDAYKNFSNRVNIIKLWHGNASRDTIRGITEEIQGKLTVCDDIYVSIDLDIVDPAYAPGVQTPEPLGIDPTTLLDILKNVVDNRVKIFDVVEVAPHYDSSGATSFLAAKVIIEVAALRYMHMAQNVEKHRCW